MSCNNQPYKVKSNFDNGNPEVIVKEFPDTIIYGKKFSYIHEINFNENGNTLRKGFYINQIAFGSHSFFENNKLACIKLILFQILSL